MMAALARAPRALWAILALALVARIAAIVATPDFKPIFDALDFHRHAESLAAGDGYPTPQLGTEGPTAFRPPLYPVALAALEAVGGGWTAERLLGALLGTVTVLLVFLVADRALGRRTATVAAAIAAVFPPLVVLSASLLSELLFTPLVLGSVLAVQHHRDDPRLRWAIAAGVLCGLAVLTRNNGLPIVLALALGVWTLRPRFGRAGLLAPAALVLATLVVVSPWVVRNALVFDRFVGLGTSAGYALAGTYNDESRAIGDHPGEPVSPNLLRTFDDVLRDRSQDEAEMIGELNDRAVEYMRDNPGYVVETAAWNVPRVLDMERRDPFEKRFAALQLQALGVERLDSKPLFLGSLYLVLLLALAGAVALVAGRRGRGGPAFLWLVPLLLLLPALVIFGLPRYRAPVDPFIVMLAAAGVVAAWERLRGHPRAAPADG